MSANAPVFTGEFLVPGSCERWTEALHYARYKFASQYVAGKDVLDIACGVGYGAALLAGCNAHSIEGVDIRADNVSYASSQYHAHNLRYCQGDVVKYGEPKSYDVIVCFETIEHIPLYYKALLNFKRLLRPGGLLLVSSPNRILSSPGRRVNDPPENRFHIREFTQAELQLLVEAAGFQMGSDDIFGQAFQLVSSSLIITKTLRKFLIRPFGSTGLFPDHNTMLKPNYFILRAKNSDSSYEGLQEPAIW